MKPVLWMAAASAVTCAGAIGIAGRGVAVEIAVGMLGPLFVVAASWLAVEQTYRRAPERLTAMMVRGLLGKVIFFAVYVPLALKGLRLRPMPFVVSFTSYFVALYFAEALLMRRLFARGVGTRN
jgi:hypothetical protein